MYFQKNFYKILLLTFLLFSITFTQENARKIDLETAIELALAQNHNLRIAEMEIDKSYSKLTEALSNLFPKLSANGQYTNNIKKPVIFLPPGTPFSAPGKPGVLEIGSDHAYTGTISATLPIFSFPIYASLSVASSGVDLAQESFKGTQLKTVSDVKKAFYGVLLAREVRNLMEASLKNAMDNLENVKRMQKQGLVSEYDLIRAEVQVENLKPVVLQAENNFELVKNSLKLALGIEVHESIEIVGELKIENQEIPDLNKTLSLLQQNNSELKQLNLQIQIAKSMINLERSAHLPILAAFGNYQYQTQANDLKFKDYKWVNTQLWGLQLQIPIFNGFGTEARVDQAQISYQQALERQNLVTESFKIQAQNILFRIEQAKKRIEGQDKAVAQAEKGYEIAKSRYSNGLGTQLEVNDAELALTQAKVNYIQSIYDYNTAIAELEQLIGKSN